LGKIGNKRKEKAVLHRDQKDRGKSLKRGITRSQALSQKGGGRGVKKPRDSTPDKKNGTEKQGERRGG